MTSTKELTNEEMKKDYAKYSKLMIEWRKYYRLYINSVARLQKSRDAWEVVRKKLDRTNKAEKVERQKIKSVERIAWDRYLRAVKDTDKKSDDMERNSKALEDCKEKLRATGQFGPFMHEFKKKHPKIYNPRS